MTFIYASLVLSGLIPLAIVLLRMQKMKTMRRKGVKATATVKEVYGYSYKGLNKVLLEYKVNETASTLSKDVMVAGVPYEPGDQITILYEKDAPEKIVIEQGKTYVSSVLYASLFAAVYIFLCYLVYKNIQADL